MTGPHLALVELLELGRAAAPDDTSSAGMRHVRECLECQEQYVVIRVLHEGEMLQRRRRWRLAAAVAASLLLALTIGAWSGGWQFAGSSGPQTYRIEEREGVTWVLNTGPGVWGEPEEPPVELVLEQTFGVDVTPEEAMLGGIDAVDVDADGNVYVLDARSSRLVAFSPDGTVLWRAGSAGEGPGELQDPAGMALDGAGSLFVSNQSGAVLDRFELDGRFVERRRLIEAGIGDFDLDGFLDPQTMVGHDALMGEVGFRLLVVRAAGESLELVAEREIDLSPDTDLPPQVGISHPSGVPTVGEHILVGHDSRWEIRAFDASLTLRRVVARADVDHLVRTGFSRVGSSAVTVVMGHVGPPIVFPDGTWMVTSSWPTEIDDPDAYARRLLTSEPEIRPDRGPSGRSLDFLDPDGRLLGGLEWVGDAGPDIGRPATAGPDGRLYTTLAAAFPQVRRYRVVLPDGRDLGPAVAADVGSERSVRPADSARSRMRAIEPGWTWTAGPVPEKRPAFDRFRPIDEL